MEFENYLMSQLVFKFPFKTKYYEQDFYVSSNNFSAYKLIESWAKMARKMAKCFWLQRIRKNTFIKNSRKKIEKVKILDETEVSYKIFDKFNEIDCLIIENYNNKIEEKLFYSILNEAKQLENYVLVNSAKPLKENHFKLKDLQSRINSFVYIGIDLPTDDLLKVIISKFFSEKQINLEPKVTEYIIKNVDRSYEKMIKFIKDIDELSLSSGKSININLIKKLLSQ